MRTATTYEERLYFRIDQGGTDAVDAAVALLERHEPDSLAEALALPSPGGAELAPDLQETVTTAWGRYFHIRTMSWD
jgi:hypothetical protein